MAPRETIAKTPEEVVPLAVEAISAGDMDGTLAMYEPNACFVGPTGEVANGHAELRDALLPFSALKPQFSFEVERIIHGADIALICGRWSFTGTDPDGNTVEMAGRNVDVARQQPDGSWRLVIDNPFASA
jgi:ketosteroid isomerase-like protein